MAFVRADLKSDAKQQLSGYWGAFIVALLIMMVVSGVITYIFDPAAEISWTFYPEADAGTYAMYSLSGLVGIVINLLVISPITLGWYGMALDRTYNRPVAFQTVFNGFKRVWDAIVLAFLYGLFIFLWSLLLFIPGVIKTYSYAMCYYILNDNPDMKPLEAITKSREMMDGHKFELFVLQLSFIPWMLLVVVTFGLAAFYVTPYILLTEANFYRRLKAEQEVANLGGYGYTDAQTQPNYGGVQPQAPTTEAPELAPEPIPEPIQEPTQEPAPVEPTQEPAPVEPAPEVSPEVTPEPPTDTEEEK